MAQCHLVQGAFAKLIQACLGIAAISVLYFKRRMQDPKRPIKIWLMDVGKQGIGAMYIHLFNLVQSTKVSLLSDGDSESDPCAVYFLTMVIDVTGGCILVYYLLRGSEALAAYFKISSLEKSGSYGDPPSMKVWGAQMASWIGIQTLMKAMVLLLMFVCMKQLNFLAQCISDLFEAHRHVELTMVMVVGPCVLNALQFWVVDTFIQEKETSKFEKIPMLPDSLKERLN